MTDQAELMPCPRCRVLREALEAMREAALYVSASGARGVNAKFRKAAEDKFFAANELARKVLEGYP